MAPKTLRRLAVLGLLALVVGGCGGGLTHHGSGPASGAITREVAVVKAWANALRRGDVNTAATYFALPSVFADGTSAGGEIAAITLRTSAQARAVNQSLPCGARYVSATPEGRYLDVLFVLTGRLGPGGTSCPGGVGETARTDFLIRHAKIVAWIRAPDVATGPPTVAPTNPAAPTQTQPGPQVSV